MASRHFFATADDLLPIFADVERKHLVKYTLTGLFETSIVSTVDRGADIPTLRLRTPDSAVACPSYLVTPLECQVAIRPVPQRRGGTMYAVDQLENPDSTNFSPGGFYSDAMLLYGRVATVSEAPIAKAFQSAFSRAIARHFVKVKAFYVGPQAAEHMRNGCRLSIGAHSPVEYDLAPDRS